MISAVFTSRARNQGRMLVERLESRQLLTATGTAPDGASVQSLPPPRVSGLYVSGSRWSQSFKDYLADQSRGSAVHGWNVISNNPNGVVWLGIDQVTLIFQREMMVDAEDVSVRGVNVRNYAIGSFRSEYGVDGERTTVTCTLATPLMNDRIAIEVNGDAPDGVRIRDTQIFLDGDGDSQPGGDFRQTFYSHPGDAAPDGRVNAIDLAGVRRGMSSSAGEMRYSAWYDVDGSARINALDLAAVRQRLGTRVPDGEPTLATATPTAGPSAADELFGSAPILA